MLYLELCKLLKIPILVSINIKGYGICFDEGGLFSIGHINNGRKVIHFGVHENSVIHSNNKANNKSIMGDDIVKTLLSLVQNSY